MFTVNGEVYNDNHGMRRAVITEEILSAFHTGEPIEVHYRVGSGMVTMISEIAKELDVQFADVRTNMIMPEDLNGIPVTARDGSLQIVEFDLQRSLKLNPLRRAIIVASEFNHADPTVQEFIRKQKLAGTVFIHAHYG